MKLGLESLPVGNLQHERTKILLTECAWVGNILLDTLIQDPDLHRTPSSAAILPMLYVIPQNVLLKAAVGSLKPVRQIRPRQGPHLAHGAIFPKLCPTNVRCEESEQMGAFKCGLDCPLESGA